MAKKNVYLSDNANDNARECPNSGATAHTSVSEQAACLSPAQMRAAIAQANINPGSPLDRYARYRAWTADLDADDLLQEAILRAISSRSCPSRIPIDELICAADFGTACRSAIERVCEGDPLLVAVFDGIDQGLCGEALASHAETDKATLATKRRLIKRRVTIEWGALADLDEAA